jgi:hypothetical protein
VPVRYAVGEAAGCADAAWYTVVGEVAYVGEGLMMLLEWVDWSARLEHLLIRVRRVGTASLEVAKVCIQIPLADRPAD